MNKPTRNRIVTTSFNQAEFAAFIKNSPREVTSQRLSLGRLFDPNWANADLCASVHAQLPLHMLRISGFLDTKFDTVDIEFGTAVNELHRPPCRELQEAHRLLDETGDTYAAGDPILMGS